MFSRLLRKLLLPALLWAPLAVAAPETQPATWQQHEITLDYLGFTTHYSCDGLRDELRWVLKALGARADSKVQTYGCTSIGGGPDRFPSSKIAAWTLQPAANAAQTGAMEATWQTVDLGGPHGLGRGQCELAEEIHKTVLPLFATRNLRFSTNCVPHQESVGEVTFRVEVLMPVAAPLP